MIPQALPLINFFIKALNNDFLNSRNLNFQCISVQTVYLFYNFKFNIELFLIHFVV